MAKNRPNLTDAVWASGVAEMLRGEIGMPRGSYWVGPIAGSLAREVESGVTREHALQQIRFRLFGEESA